MKNFLLYFDHPWEKSWLVQEKGLMLGRTEGKDKRVAEDEMVE